MRTETPLIGTLIACLLAFIVTTPTFGQPKHALTPEVALEGRWTEVRAWPSPTGRHAVVVHRELAPEERIALLTFDRRGTRVEDVSDELGMSVRTVSWSPDGRVVAIATYGDDVSDVTIFVIATRERLRVSNPGSDAMAISPTWDERGDWLFYLSMGGAPEFLPGVFGVRVRDRTLHHALAEWTFWDLEIGGDACVAIGHQGRDGGPSNVNRFSVSELKKGATLIGRWDPLTRAFVGLGEAGSRSGAR